jgi:lipopolysaccharide export LptBFGC system permease protein LptF
MISPISGVDGKSEDFWFIPDSVRDSSLVKAKTFDEMQQQEISALIASIEREEDILGNLKILMSKEKEWNYGRETATTTAVAAASVAVVAEEQPQLFQHDQELYHQTQQQQQRQQPFPQASLHHPSSSNRHQIQQNHQHEHQYNQYQQQHQTQQYQSLPQAVSLSARAAANVFSPPSMNSPSSSSIPSRQQQLQPQHQPFSSSTGKLSTNYSQVSYCVSL